MLRIIGGTCRGRKLQAPDGLETRPTMDRVRVTVFDMLQNEVRDADVLDLYAGSGAMGLEALSRGARSAVLTDNNRAAQQVIRSNIDLMRMSDRAELLRMNDLAALDAVRDRRFDLVFLDPPYRMDLTDVMTALKERKLLRRGAIVIAEYSMHEPRVDELFECVKSRTFAQIHVKFYRLKEDLEQ